MRPDVFRMALKIASAGMLKEAGMIDTVGRGVAAAGKGVWGGTQMLGRATGVTPLAQGVLQSGGAAGSAQQVAAQALRATGIRRLGGTAVLTGATAMGVSGAKASRRTSELRQQQYGNVDPRYRRPNPARGHSQTGLY